MASPAHAEPLDHDQCLRRVATVTVGRIAVSIGALPVVHPIRFVLVSGCIVFSLPPASPFWRATADRVIGFEADNAQDGLDDVWSVMAQGICREVRSVAHVEQLGELPIPRWQTRGAADHLMILPLDHIDGERTHWGGTSST
jgi:nitroimidazol reductase NimA-like FMN-containing flavoprotein (pyridoxamine 5'-phosphate oxidase superfamily)